MKKRKIPLRKCVVTQERKEKKDLIRVVRTPDNDVVVDLNGKTNGRGAYLTKEKEVILIAQRKKILDRHLDVSVADEIFIQLLEIVGE